MTDGDALLKSILAHPGEDTPRLVYADWLDEHDSHERAAFIRTQIAIERSDRSNWRPCQPHGTTPGGTACPCERCVLQRRERVLLELPCRSTHGESNWAAWSRPMPLVSRSGLYAEQPFAFRRGFVGELRCPIEGFERTAGILFASHPIESVQLVGRKPLDRHTRRSVGSWEYGWLSDVSVSTTTYAIYPEIHTALKAGRGWAGGHWRIYPSEEQALQDLSDACCTVGRNRVKKVKAVTA